MRQAPSNGRSGKHPHGAAGRATEDGRDLLEALHALEISGSDMPATARYNLASNFHMGVSENRGTLFGASL